MKNYFVKFKKYLVLLIVISVASLSLTLLLHLHQQKKSLQNSQAQTVKTQQNVLAGSTTGCFSGGWNARKKITFNNSSGTANSLVNFPVLVKLDANRIDYSKTHNNGADIRFEDPSSPGTWLPHEIETWSITGSSYVWVKVPQIEASSNDYIWMYYDNASATDAQEKSAVWDSSYKGVWHLGSLFYDSTSNANHGTNFNTTVGAGQMGNATNFAGTSTADQYVSVPNSATLNFGTTQNYTLEAWVKLPQDQNTKTYPDNDIVTKWVHDTSPPVNPYPFNLRTTNSSSAGGAGEIYSNRYDANGVNPNCSSLPNKFNNNSWVHIAAIKFGTNMTIYVNGSQVCASSDTTTATTTNSDPVTFGRRGNARNWLTGSIDEVRISNTNRSADWVKAEYITAKDSMNSFGSEEICAGSATTAIANPTITPTKTPTPTPVKTPTPIKTPTPYYSPTPTPYAYNSGGGSTNIGGYAYPTTNVIYNTTQSTSQGTAQSTTQSTIQNNTQPVTNTNQTSQNSASTPIDRLASQDPATLKCISSILSADELNRLRYLQPKIASEEDELKALQDKVKICFQTYTDVVKIQEASKQISDLPQEVKQCVVSAVGLPAYEQIQGGVREPTQQEKVNSQTCFAKQAPVQIAYQTSDKPLDTSVDTCLVLALGTDRFSQIKTQKLQPTLSEKEKIDRCFGVNPNPLSTQPKYTIPSSVETCVKRTVSENKFLTIKAGLQEPTDDEKSKANQCFSKLNPLQTQLLAAPPVQVPYLKTNNDNVKIQEVVSKTETTAAAKTDNVVVMQGKSQPNTLVYIYVFSDPIVVETQTDQNGDWVYKLNEPLEKGTHLAYATVRNSTGEQVRSSVFNFNVVYAAEPSVAIGQQYFAENNASAVPSKFFDSSVIMIGGALLLGVIITLITVLKNQQPKAVPAPGPSYPRVPTPTPSSTPNSSDGQGKGENSSSSVN